MSVVVITGASAGVGRREVVVPEDQSGRGVQPRDEQAGKHGEGVMIAPLRSLDELPLVHDPPDYVVGAAGSPRSDGSRQARVETFPGRLPGWRKRSRDQVPR
jgi:hypothetical protein